MDGWKFPGVFGGEAAGGFLDRGGDGAEDAHGLLHLSGDGAKITARYLLVSIPRGNYFGQNKARVTGLVPSLAVICTASNRSNL